MASGDGSPARMPIASRGVGVPPAADRIAQVARPSFADVYGGGFDYVWHALRRLGIPDADLEDGVQDVFVVVHRRLADYEPERPLRPWLFGIAYRIASQRRRRGDPAALGQDQLLGLPDASPSPEALLDGEQARRRVHRALDALPLEQKAVMILHDLEGHSAPDVAEALGVPLNTVYSRLRLGREKFVATIREGGPR
jgi:RNA polymerase sigma-70 factor, ECF subfamily